MMATHWLAWIALLSFAALVHGASANHDGSSPANPDGKSPTLSVYVHGAVQKPGRYDWREGMTAVHAITAAGGLKRNASLRILVLHADGTKTVFSMDPNPAASHNAPAVSSGDVVAVRPTQSPNQPEELTRDAVGSGYDRVYCDINWRARQPLTARCSP